MPYLFHRISNRQFRVYEFITEHVRATAATPTEEAICLYFRAKRCAVRISLAILERHRFIARADDFKRSIQIIDRQPLLMPYRGTVK